MAPPPPPLPRYGEASLAELLPSLLAALDVPGARNPLGLEPLRRVCLLVVDGLGWELLLANRESAPFLAAVLGSYLVGSRWARRRSSTRRSTSSGSSSASR